MKPGTIVMCTPEQWGSLEKFSSFYSGTYKFGESGKRAVSRAINHLCKGLLLRDLASKLIPNLEVDEVELNQHGFTHAVLGQTADAEETLRQAAQRIDHITDPATKANLMAASGILAGLKLEQEVIYCLLRRDIMQESTVCRSILAEGKAETQREIATNLLQAGIAVNIIISKAGLLIGEVQQLQQQLSNASQS